MPDWSWWDAWRSGDPDASRDALDAETDRSLERDPGRWSWKSSSEAIDEERRRSGWGSHSAGQRHRTGKGHVEKGESGERTQWRDHEWRTAREDYERQNPDRNERDDDRGIFW